MEKNKKQLEIFLYGTVYTLRSDLFKKEYFGENMQAEPGAPVVFLDWESKGFIDTFVSPEGRLVTTYQPLSSVRSLREDAAWFEIERPIELETYGEIRINDEYTGEHLKTLHDATIPDTLREAADIIQRRIDEYYK